MRSLWLPTVPKILAALVLGLLGGYLLGLLRNRGAVERRPVYVAPRVSDDRFARP